MPIEVLLNFWNRPVNRDITMSSPTKPTVIEDLPLEMICELFRHLHLKDLAACSMVNKRWQLAYSDFKLERLVVFDQCDYYYLVGEWRYSDREVEDKELCHLRTLKSLADKPLVSKLKHLLLCDYCSGFDPNQLNCFQNLVHLEINTEYISKDINEISLRFKKLKILTFNKEIVCRYVNQKTRFLVDCPELNVLLYRENTQFEKVRTYLDIQHPEKIRKLETNMVVSELARFKNVECLITDNLEVISKSALEALPKLKELHFNQCIWSLFKSNSKRPGTMNRIKRILREFLTDLEVFSKPDFKFRFAGFPLTETMLEGLDFGMETLEDRDRWLTFEKVSNEFIYMKNYQLIHPDDTLRFIRRLDYNCLIANVTNEIPSDFFKKLGSVQVIVCGAVGELNHLLWFLSSLGSKVKEIEIEGVQLKQYFYDQLPSVTPSLVILRIKRVSLCRNELQLCFNFIDKLPRLSMIFITEGLTIESISSLVRCSDKVTDVSFFYQTKKNTFPAQKSRALDSEGLWWFSASFPSYSKTTNPDELINYFVKLKEETD